MRLHAAIGQPLPRDPGKAGGDPLAGELTGIGHGRVFGDTERQPAGADAEVKPVDELFTALGHEVGTGDAEINRTLGREHGNVVGAQKDHLDRHAPAQREQAPLVAAKGDAGVVEQLRGDFCEASLAGNTDPQQRCFGVITHDGAPSVRWGVEGEDWWLPPVRDAFSSRPEMPKRRASSSSTWESPTPRQASRTSMW